MCITTKKMITPKFVALVVLFLALHIGGCGGGTTGTSPVGEFKVLGTVLTSKGEPIANASMVVISENGTTRILEAETNSAGEYEMELPETEERIFFEIGEQKTPALSKSLPGSTVTSATVVQNSNSDLDFQNSFEAQIIEDELCNGLRTEGNQIFMTQDVDPILCPVGVRVLAKDGTDDTFKASLTAYCGSDSKLYTATGLASTENDFKIDLNSVLNSDCSTVEITISSSDTSLRPISFPVNLQ